LLHELVKPPNLIDQMDSANPLVSHLIGGHDKIMGQRDDKRTIPTIVGVIRGCFLYTQRLEIHKVCKNDQP
jgi:hypothetical protein